MSMGFTETFNTRVLPAAQRAFGISAQYSRWADAITVFVGPSDLLRRQGAIGNDASHVKTKTFVLSAALFLVGRELEVPESGEYLTWMNPQDSQESWTVFPLVNEQCSEFVDLGQSQLRLFTVETTAMQPIKITLAGGQPPIEALVVPGQIRGAEDFVSSGSETRVLTTTAYIARKDLGNVATPPPAATAEFLGMEGWAIDLNRTEWGPGLVKLGLVRETLVREWQARRNATV